MSENNTSGKKATQKQIALAVVRFAMLYSDLASIVLSLLKSLELLKAIRACMTGRMEREQLLVVFSKTIDQMIVEQKAFKEKIQTPAQ